MNKNQIKKDVLTHIKEHPKEYPFISRFWDVEIDEIQTSVTESYIDFGHFNTQSTHSSPFYKPISKIIDLSKLV